MMKDWHVEGWSRLEREVLTELSMVNYVIKPKWGNQVFGEQIEEGYIPEIVDDKSPYPLKFEGLQLFQNGIIIPIDCAISDFYKTFVEEKKKFIHIPDLMFAHEFNDIVEVIPMDIKDSLSREEIPFQQISAFNLKFLIESSNYLQEAIALVEEHYKKKAVLQSGCFLVDHISTQRSELLARHVELNQYVETQLTKKYNGFSSKYMHIDVPFKGINLSQQAPKPRKEPGVIITSDDYFIESFPQSELWSRLGFIQNKINTNGFYDAYMTVCAGFLMDETPLKRLEVDPFLGVEQFSPEILELKEELNCINCLSLYHITEMFPDRIREYIEDLGDAYIRTLESRIGRITRSRDSSKQKLERYEKDIELAQLQDKTLAKYSQAKDDLDQFFEEHNLTFERLNDVVKRKIKDEIRKKRNKVIRLEQAYYSSKAFQTQNRYLAENKTYAQLEAELQATRSELSIAKAQRIELLSSLDPKLYFKHAQAFKKKQIDRLSQEIETTETAMSLTTYDKKRLTEIAKGIAEQYDKEVKKKAVLEIERAYRTMNKKYKERHTRSMDLTRKMDRFHRRDYFPCIADKDTLFPHPTEVFIQLGEDQVYRILTYNVIHLRREEG
jgi:hypothetical protein